MISGTFEWIQNIEGHCNLCGKSYTDDERVGVFKVDQEGRDVRICPMCLVKATQQIVDNV
jgi:hypothetical protein